MGKQDDDKKKREEQKKASTEFTMKAALGGKSVEETFQLPKTPFPKIPDTPESEKKDKK